MKGIVVTEKPDYPVLPSLQFDPILALFYCINAASVLIIGKPF